MVVVFNIKYLVVVLIILASTKLQIRMERLFPHEARPSSTHMTSSRCKHKNLIM
jgi:hypothetical protein